MNCRSEDSKHPMFGVFGVFGMELPNTPNIVFGSGAPMGLSSYLVVGHSKQPNIPLTKKICLAGGIPPPGPPPESPLALSEWASPNTLFALRAGVWFAPLKEV